MHKGRNIMQHSQRPLTIFIVWVCRRSAALNDNVMIDNELRSVNLRKRYGTTLIEQSDFSG